MRSLIRFEDTYGMADIFCANRNLGYIKEQDVNTLLKITEDLYIENGKGILPCLSFSDAEIFEIQVHGIEQVIFVFDLDNESGKKDKVLSQHNKL